MANYKGNQKIRRYRGIRKIGRRYVGDGKHYQGEIIGTAPQDPRIALGFYNWVKINTRPCCQVVGSVNTTPQDIDYDANGYIDEAQH